MSFGNRQTERPCAESTDCSTTSLEIHSTELESLSHFATRLLAGRRDGLMKSIGWCISFKAMTS